MAEEERRAYVEARRAVLRARVLSARRDNFGERVGAEMRLHAAADALRQVEALSADDLAALDVEAVRREHEAAVEVWRRLSDLQWEFRRKAYGWRKGERAP